MTAGRKPKPTALKELAGNPGKRPLPAAEPQPAASIPGAPPHLNEEALAEWGRITLELHSVGLIAEVDRAALASYCVCWSDWCEARRHIEAEGAIIRSGNKKSDDGQAKLFNQADAVGDDSGFPLQNPWVAIANKAMLNMLKIAAEFGMTPSSRTRLHSGIPDDANEAEKFFFGQEADQDGARTQ